MKSLKKTIIVIILILIITLIYIFSFSQKNTISSNNMIDQNDSIPPYIRRITGNITCNAGEKTTILVNFSDKMDVKNAIIYYKPATAIHWSSKSIINGTFEIIPPLSSNESWYYYVIIDDTEGNGFIGNPSVDGSVYYTIKVLNNNKIQNNNEENNKYLNNSPIVFVEIATKIVCSECPKISSIMYELYESGKFPFYYVSLPIDNPKAAEYLKLYNVWGYPTVFIDGGYEITVGSSVDKELLQKKIQSAENRIKPKLKINTQVEYITESKSIHLIVDLKNNEASLYNGELRVYLTEINSKKWQAGTPEHFSFLSFPLIELVELSGYKNQTFTTTIEIPDLDPDNIMIFSVVSNKESHTHYSQPTDKNEFQAHYIDAFSAEVVIKDGNLPPEVGIENPTVKYFYLFGKQIKKTNFGKTILIGRIPVVAYADDDSNITKVEFYINNKLMKTITEKPYEWLWHSLSIGKKTIMVKAYDDKGKTSSASIDVIVLIKWQGLFSRLLSK